jgi:predicted Holliday junction resolvase-like endonuclease
MIQVLLALIGVLVVAVLVLFLVLRIQKQSLDRVHSELNACQSVMDDTKKELIHQQQTLKTQVKIEEKAHEERQDLSKSSDTALVDRANKLF